MLEKAMLEKARNIYREFPVTFWTLIGATFIDQLGGALVFPFLALYLTQRFQIGMTQVGQLLAIFAIASLFGNALSGALTDKFGRRKMILFSLIASSFTSVSMGVADQIALFYPLAALVGLLSNTGGPAQQAMVADLLPHEKRSEGFGIMRVFANLAFTIGPAIGGILAVKSYLLLFIWDALTSTITAGIVLAVIPETLPAPKEGEPPKSLAQTIRGYSRALRDWIYMFFLLVTILSLMVYVQINSTLSVFLRDVHGVSPRGFGYILSFSAGMVVLFQFWVTRRISKRPPMALMAVGTLFYALGFALYGFVSTYLLFITAICIITLGEMIVVPTSQALVARLAPEDMRGRYMALYGLSWLLPTALGPLVAGVIMDQYDPNWVWYASGIVSLIAVSGYIFLFFRGGARVNGLAEATAPALATNEAASD
jgi:MFS family permease